MLRVFFIYSFLLWNGAYAQCHLNNTRAENNDLNQSGEQIIMALALDQNRLALSEFCEDSWRWSRDEDLADKYKGRVGPRKRKPGPAGKTYGSQFTNPKYFRGCSEEIPWMENIRNTLCEEKKLKSTPLLSEINPGLVPPHFVFIFDGFGNFNGNYGQSYGAINLDGSEGKDFGMGYPMGLLNFLGPVQETMGEQYQMHYHASSGFHPRENVDSAIACARQMHRYLDVLDLLAVDYINPNWIAIGFSNGGFRAIEFQNKLGKDGNSLDLVFTVDPVVQWIGYPFSGLNETLGQKHPHTKRFVNFFQNDDQGSMPVLHLEGKPVRQADVNLEITPEIDQGLEVGGKNHINIVYSTFVRNALTCELERLQNPSTPECSYPLVQTE